MASDEQITDCFRVFHSRVSWRNIHQGIGAVQTWICRVRFSCACLSVCVDCRALSGACDKDYDYGIADGRCSKCSSAQFVLKRVVLCVAVAATIAVAAFLWAWCRHWCSDRLPEIMREHATADGGIELAGFFHHVTTPLAGEGAHKGDEAPREERQREMNSRRRRLRRSLLTKIKIVLASWQIAASTEMVCRRS